MYLNIEDFLQELEDLNHKLLHDSKIEIIYKRIDKISLRIRLTASLFIDVYINTDTDRYDFSLIGDNKRIFGYDNLGGWHYHPIDRPEDHIRCKKPSLKNIFQEIIKHYENSNP